MRKIVVAVVCVAALAAAGYGYARFKANQIMAAGLANFTDSLPPGASLVYASAEPRLLSRSAHLTGVRLVMPGATYTAAEADIAPDGPDRLRFLRLRDAVETAASATTSIASVEAEQVSVAGDAAWTGSFEPKATRASHIALHGVHFAGADQTEMTIADCTLDNYGPGRPATLDLRAVGVSAPGGLVGRLDIAHIKLAGVDLTRLMPPADTGFGLSPPGADPLAEASGLRVMAGGKPLISVASVAASLTHLAVTDLVVLADDQLTPGLRQAGYDRFQGTLVVDGALDVAARRLRIDQVDLLAANMAHAHLAVALDNLPPDLLGPALDARHLQLGLAELIGLQLRSLDFSLEDRSLTGKLLAAAAAQRGVPPAQLLAVVQSQVQALAAQYRVPDAASAPVLAFLADPHWLVVAAHPPQPVPVIGLLSLIRSAPGQPLGSQALGLQVTNQAPAQ